MTFAVNALEARRPSSIYQRRSHGRVANGDDLKSPHIEDRQIPVREPALRARLLGTFRLEDIDGNEVPMSLRKAQACLAYIAMAESAKCARDQLATLLWADSSQHLARQSLRQTILTLSRQLDCKGTPALDAQSQSLAVRRDIIWVDAIEFQALAARNDLESLQHAADLYSGHFLEHFSVDESAFDSWADAVRARLSDLAINVLMKLRDHHLARGNPDAAVAAAKRMLEIDPLREEVHRWVMQTYYQRGQRSLALAQYRTCREVMRRELDVVCETRTDELAEKILNQSWIENPTRTDPRRMSHEEHSVSGIEHGINSGSMSEGDQADQGASIPESTNLKRQDVVSAAMARGTTPDLSRLTPNSRRLAQAAALGGIRARSATLMSVTGMMLGEASPALEELEEAGILMTDETDLVFLDDDLREAIAAEVPQPEARRIHLNYVRHFEASESRHSTNLAMHYLKAGKFNAYLGQIEREVQIELNLGRLANAQDLLRNALRDVKPLAGNLVEGERLAEAYLTLLGITCLRRRDDQLAFDLETAAPVVGICGNRPQKARFDLYRSRFAQRKRDLRRATDFCRRATAVAALADYETLLTRSECLIQRLALLNEKHHGLEQELSDELENARRYQTKNIEIDAGLSLALLLGVRGDLEVAQNYCKDAIELANSTPHEISVAIAQQTQGVLFAWQGEFQPAEQAFLGSERIFEEEGDLLRLYVLSAYRGMAAVQKGDCVAAVEWLRKAIASADNLETRFMLPMVKGWLAEAYIGKGSFARALQTGRNACRIASESNNGWARSISARAVARALAMNREAPLPLAERALRSAIEIQSSLGLTLEHKRSLDVKAELRASARSH